MESGDLQAVRESELDAREVALLELIDTETRHADRVSDEQVDRLRSLGWTDEQLFEAVWVAAAFAYMTRIVDVFGIRWSREKTQPGALGLRKGKNGS